MNDVARRFMIPVMRYQDTSLVYSKCQLRFIIQMLLTRGKGVYHIKPALAQILYNVKRNVLIKI